jgi:hypothetical protein
MPETFDHILTETQIKTLDSMGYIEIDDSLMSQILNWAQSFCDDVNNTIESN